MIQNSMSDEDLNQLQFLAENNKSVLVNDVSSLLSLIDEVKRTRKILAILCQEFDPSAPVTIRIKDLIEALKK